MAAVTSFFSAASSLLPRSSALSSSYTLSPASGSSSSSNGVSTSASSASASSSSSAAGASCRVGVWTVHQARHNSSGKRVSIWICDKAALASAGSGATSLGSHGTSARSNQIGGAVERALEVLRREVSMLSKLRHPCILEIREPLEESRSTLTFATEPVTSSLRMALSRTSPRRRAGGASSSRDGTLAANDDDNGELDEIEVQKGVSTVVKGLEFLHENAKIVHANLTGDSIVINDKGDWKLCGFGLSMSLFEADRSTPARWQWPDYEPALPDAVQRDWDYIAPEYLLDEMAPSPANDLYSLGILLHTIHLRPAPPPFSHRHSLENARRNLSNGLERGELARQWRTLPSEVRGALEQLITRRPSERLSTARAFLAHSYFSSIHVSTLRFLERESFAQQTPDAQVSFLKGLEGMLANEMQGGFSRKIKRRKILPMLLDEIQNGRREITGTWVWKCVRRIADDMSKDEFESTVLPSIKPLFTVREPPQIPIALLDSMPMFVNNCDRATFRAEVMPLVYHALDADAKDASPALLEKALKVVPTLSEVLDYTTVKQTLYPKIERMFARTTLLSVKVNTLICFHSMVPILDRYTLTDKVVPLLAKIKTKEPAVMLATLAVHERMGEKVSIETVATLILPQLWSMSVGPLLNKAQFERFQAVITRLGDRVKLEHGKRLEELGHLEEGGVAATANARNQAGTLPNGLTSNGEIDFESLVRGVGGAPVNAGAAQKVVQDPWGDELGSVTPPMFTSTSPALGASSSNNNGMAKPASMASNATPSFDAYSARSSSPAAAPQSAAPLRAVSSFAPMQPSRPSHNYSSSPVSSAANGNKPNYNISLPSQAPGGSNSWGASSTPSATWSAPQPAPSWGTSAPAASQGWKPPAASPLASPPVRSMASPPPPGFGSVLQPTVVQKKNTIANTPFGDWADLDPLK